ncbi:MAG: hypothetical protein ABJB12_18550 [Pseudomonadota bacterium]
MSLSDLRKWLSGLGAVCLTALAACLNNAGVPALSPAAQAVRVSSADPPPGAHLVGPLSATHGHGCGIANQRGTEDGATAALREAAARRGATFVKVTKTVTPHPGHDCFHQEFTLEGLAYSVAENKTVAPPVRSAPVLAAPTAATISSDAPDACTPPCSPGYACHAGGCEAECNPPCAADQTCRGDHVCVARAASDGH